MDDNEKFYDDLAKELAPKAPIKPANEDDPFVAETELKRGMENDFTRIHNVTKRELIKPPEKPLSLILPLAFILTVLLWAYLTGRV